MTGRVWKINSPAVVGEIIDGELVAMDLKLGFYFSASGTGALIWQCVERGQSTEDITQIVATAYGRTAKEIAGDVRIFLERLVQERLIREELLPEGVEATATFTPSVAVSPNNYLRPEIQKYTDMQDLLLLDPIHDVGEEGWPTRSTESAAPVATEA